MDNPVEEIKNRLTIEEIVGQYLQLKKAGTNFTAPCPFHNEKKPSFMVSPEKGIWHCFGCGKGGDIFSFVMEVEGLDFKEALRFLADKSGVELKRPSAQQRQEQGQKSKLFEIHELAARFFNEALQKSQAGRPVLDYLKKRGISAEAIKEFGIGYAPPGWDFLLKFLRGRGYSDTDIISSGLVVKKDSGKIFDRFRHRLIFPIRQITGRTVAFGGRTLQDVIPREEGHKDEAKYLNSPETPIYNKSYILYNLDKARTDIKAQQYTVLVEGYTDVVASYMSGARNVVATSGTALTSGHIKLLQRYANNLIASFDQDEAGELATERGIELLLGVGMNVKVNVLPQGQDPADVIADDPQAWARALKEAPPVADFIFNYYLADLDPSNAKSKKEAAHKVINFLVKLPDPVERDHYLPRLVEKLQVSEESLRQLLSRQDSEAPEDSEAKEQTSVAKIETDPSVIRLVGLLLKFPAELHKGASKLVPHLPDDDSRLLLQQLGEYYETEQKLPYQQIRDKIAAINSNWAKLMDQSILGIERDLPAISGEEAQEEFNELQRNLVCRNLSRQLFELEVAIKKAEETKDQEGISRLTTEFKNVSDELTKSKRD